MTLQYDIDISYVMPPEAFTDSGSAELLKASGFALNGRSNYIAKFRDPQPHLPEHHLALRHILKHVVLCSIRQARCCPVAHLMNGLMAS